MLRTASLLSLESLREPRDKSACEVASLNLDGLQEVGSSSIEFRGTPPACSAFASTPSQAERVRDELTGREARGAKRENSKL